MLKKVQPGDPLKLGASAYNAFVDAAEDYLRRQRRQAVPSARQQRQNGLCLIRNASTNDYERWDVLAIDGPLYTPTESAASFENDMVLKGVDIDTPYAGRFAVLQEPIPADGFGLAAVAGVTVARLTVQDEAHEYADIVDVGGYATFATSPTGSARILWKESGTGYKYALLRLGHNLGQPSFMAVTADNEGTFYEVAWDVSQGWWEPTGNLQGTLTEANGWPLVKDTIVEITPRTAGDGSVVYACDAGGGLAGASTWIVGPNETGGTCTWEVGQGSDQSPTKDGVQFGVLASLHCTNSGQPEGGDVIEFERLWVTTDGKGNVTKVEQGAPYHLGQWQSSNPYITTDGWIRFQDDANYSNPTIYHSTPGPVTQTLGGGGKYVESISLDAKGHVVDAVVKDLP
jgi:hypothetical protein